jgi:hypothetical protein
MKTSSLVPFATSSFLILATFSGCADRNAGHGRTTYAPHERTTVHATPTAHKPPAPKVSSTATTANHARSVKAAATPVHPAPAPATTTTKSKKVDAEVRDVGDVR